MCLENVMKTYNFPLFSYHYPKAISNVSLDLFISYTNVSIFSFRTPCTTQRTFMPILETCFCVCVGQQTCWDCRSRLSVRLLHAKVRREVPPLPLLVPRITVLGLRGKSFQTGVRVLVGTVMAWTQLESDWTRNGAVVCCECFVYIPCGLHGIGSMIQFKSSVS